MSGMNCIRCDQSFGLEALIVADDDFALCHGCSAQLKPEGEQARLCPVDGREMTKLVIYDVALIDKCVACGGVWLDQHELKIIERASRVSEAAGGAMLKKMAASPE